VDLSEYYERVERLIVALRSAGAPEAADRVEDAIRGGSTSGEILGRLSVALPEAASDTSRLADEIAALTEWTTQALLPPSSSA
jgi:hypothetical protein